MLKVGLSYLGQVQFLLNQLVVGTDPVPATYTYVVPY